jgi:peptidoglycan/xylan/chitin deacetylase (PgdA/CDA1 family)
VIHVQTLALTFDDGPDPDGTPLMLDALARADARATFFVIGPRA